MPFHLSVSQGGYTPVISVIVDGQEVAAGFYTRLIKATIRDEAGQTSDQLTVDLDDAGNAIAIPPPKAKISVSLGYKETGLVTVGIYELQSVSLRGSVDGGETMVLQASAADLKKALKGQDREAFEGKTVREIVETIARRNGLRATVDPEIGDIKIPYKARIDSSEIDFLTTLGDEVGAVIKPMGGRLVAARKGNAKAVSGVSLPPIVIEREDCSEWEIDPEGRAQYGKVKAAWIDQKTGKRRVEKAETGLEGPDFVVRAPLPSKEQAEKWAQAEARRLTRNTGSGSFSLAGRPEAQAEADVIAGSSFRDGIAGTWRADAVEHEFSKDGYTTKVEVKALEDGSSGKTEDK